MKRISLKRPVICLCLFLPVIFISAQPFASWKGNALLLDNGKVKREIRVEGNTIATRSMTVKGHALNFDLPACKEFSFRLNDREYDGRSGWTFISITAITDDHQGSGATIHLDGTGELNDISLAITYLQYPQLPVIRKQISLFNKTNKEIKLESVAVEKIKLGFSFVESVVFANYGRQKHLGTYVGNWDDAVIAIHSYAVNAGILLGNEAPGVLKRTDYNTVEDEAGIGLTHTSDIYPFRKYIQPAKSWTSPFVFVIPYTESLSPRPVMNSDLNDFVRHHMGLRIFEQKKRPTFMYNNYRPFGSSFNDTLLISLAKSASTCGIRQFEIDCGWHTTQDNAGKKVEWIANTGDWITDPLKFPKGLLPVLDTLRRLGMEPGLWISVGSAAATSRVYQQHPEWAIRDKNGHSGNMHDISQWDLNTMCFGTGWKDYIKGKIISLVHAFGLKFVKLDLSILTSAYIADYEKSGCYATDHPGHKDRTESFIAIYEGLFEMFDELHKEAPELYIDCTFETLGKLQLADYAFLQHAEGNWLTNIAEPFPVGAYRIRNLGWWKTAAIPASSLIIGNMTLDSPDFIHELKTLLGTFPIVLGDPRKLSNERRAEIKRWGDWITRMQEKYQYDLYRQELPGLGEPVEGNWDGWSRINTDTRSGGIIGIFRQGSPDNTRTVQVPGLDKSRQYHIKLAPTHQVVATMTGEELAVKGFTVKMDTFYDSEVYEIGMATLNEKKL